MLRVTRWQHQNETTLSDDEWRRPLHMVHEAILGTQLADHFDIDRFMSGPRLLRADKQPLYLYVHEDTRQPLAVDPNGAAHRYVPPNPNGLSNGRWVKYKLLEYAIHDLGLEAVEVPLARQVELNPRRRRRRRHLALVDDLPA